MPALRVTSEGFPLTYKAFCLLSEVPAKSYIVPDGWSATVPTSEEVLKVLSEEEFVIYCSDDTRAILEIVKNRPKLVWAGALLHAFREGWDLTPPGVLFPDDNKRS